MGIAQICSIIKKVNNDFALAVTPHKYQRRASVLFASGAMLLIKEK